jgi:hypothetical protein
MNIGTATAPPANGVDEVNHADASGAAAVNKDSCLITVQTTKNDVELLACARDDVVGETESARATPPRVAHRCNAVPSYSPFISISFRIFSLNFCRIRTLCCDNECCTEHRNDKSTLTLDDVRTTK